MKINLDEAPVNSESMLFFSCEWLPSLQNECMDDLVKRVVECSREFQPMFCSVMWRNNSPCVFDNSALKFAISLHQQGLTVMLHLICQGLTKEDVFQVLQEMKKYGIKNIFCLKGDSIGNKNNGYFRYAKDLVQYIRDEFGSYFTICVAGYPAGHPDTCCKIDNLKHLKEKVEAGADFIITQIVFDAMEFIKFVKNCRSCGIQVPIIPGILPIQDYELTERIEKNCCVTIPSCIKNNLRKLQDKPDELQRYGIQYTVGIVKSILNSGIEVPGVHLFTLNRPEICLRVKKEFGNKF
ncbi:methylenetetrahydrofolate reductase (NADPH) [Lycorma delicatula]|uniref:methylenetetrahydrofolate reductase (NADPH) n=1 Tax=Lycorma delicatula TaxID=130591 RepID=UPI003F5103A9